MQAPPPHPAPHQPLQPPGFQACDAWQREAKEAKERALAADSARQLALQKKEEVEAQFRQLQEELEGRGMSTLPGLRGCSDIGAIPLPKLHSLQSQLRLDLEAVDGVSLGFVSKVLDLYPWQGVCVCRGEDWGLVWRCCFPCGPLSSDSSGGSSCSAPGSVCTTSPARLALPFLSGTFHVYPLLCSHG